MTSSPRWTASTKKKDPRYSWFMEYGTQCWELDALSPVDLRERVEAEIKSVLDTKTWNRYVAADEAETASIISAVSSWNRLKVRP